MTSPPSEILAPEAQLALAHTRAPFREALRIFFELDLRLARIVAGTSEPMLGQMRLAWWRDILAKPIEERPSGDAVLDAIGECWAGREKGLIGLVDGWENLLAEPPLSEANARQFAQGRVCAMRDAFADTSDVWETCNAGANAWHWALADLAANVSEPKERDMLVALALEQMPGKPLPSPFKGVAVLGALALRSLKKDGRPLMEGRSASLTALRAAFFGR